MSVAEDWLRNLIGYPLASVYACYDAQIRQPGQWAPSLGDFLVKVKSHAQRTESFLNRQEIAIRNAEAGA